MNCDFIYIYNKNKMESVKDLNDLKVDCPICLDTYPFDKNILCVVCLHSYCEDCFLHLCNSSRDVDNMTCPSCRHKMGDSFINLRKPHGMEETRIRYIKRNQETIKEKTEAERKKTQLQLKIKKLEDKIKELENGINNNNYNNTVSVLTPCAMKKCGKVSRHWLNGCILTESCQNDPKICYGHQLEKLYTLSYNKGYNDLPNCKYMGGDCKNKVKLYLSTERDQNDYFILKEGDYCLRHIKNELKHNTDPSERYELKKILSFYE